MEHENVVQALASDGADQALYERILPGRTGSYELLLKAQGRGSRFELQAINAVAIPEHVARRLAVQECLGELLRSPRGRG